MTLVGLLGMNPTAAFPIMMGSSAFLMPVASARFVLSNKYSPAASPSPPLSACSAYTESHLA